MESIENKTDENEKLKKHGFPAGAYSKENSPLRCRIFGHKWWKKDRYGKAVAFTCCSICGLRFKDLDK